MKRWLSVLLALALTLGLTPALAAQSGEVPFTRAAFAQFLVDGLELEYDESMAGIEFPDVPRDHPNYRAIMIMARYGIMNAKGSGLFDTEGGLTRAETATMLSRMMGLSSSFGQDFPRPADIDQNSWYTVSVLAALKAGLMSTDSAGLFRPND